MTSNTRAAACRARAGRDPVGSAGQRDTGTSRGVLAAPGQPVNQPQTLKAGGRHL